MGSSVLRPAPMIHERASRTFGGGGGGRDNKSSSCLSKVLHLSFFAPFSTSLTWDKRKRENNEKCNKRGKGAYLMLQVLVLFRLVKGPETRGWCCTYFKDKF